MKQNSRKRRHPRNFWRAWEEEWRRLHDLHAAEPLDRQGAWREFFHHFTGDFPERHWAFRGRRFRPWHQGDVSFNPFVANLFSQGGGLLPLLVLHQLAESPRYGNEIMSLLSEQTSGRWSANPGAIYPLMAELEDRGLIEGDWEDPRKRTIRIYHLTELGRQELERVNAIVRPKLDEAIEVLQSITSNLEDNHNEKKEEK